jgi:hypothetical protein
MYSIQHYVVKCVSDLRMSLVFSCYFGFNFSNNIIYNQHHQEGKCHLCLLEKKYKQLFEASKGTMLHNTRRSNLEYAATVWDPYTKFNIKNKKNANVVLRILQEKAVLHLCERK